MKATERRWLTEYSPGVPADLDTGDATGLSLFVDAVAAVGSNAAIVDVGRDSLTYRQLDEAADALAVALLERGLQPGDRVAVYLQNRPEFVITELAAWKAGALLVPVNPMLKSAELEFVLQDSGARVLVLEPELRREVTLASELMLPPDELWRLVERYRGQRPPAPALKPDDVAYLVYTSGTTGQPKGAMNTHRNVAFSSCVYRAWMDLGAQDVVLGGAPLFHITGLIAGIGASHAAACPLVVFGRFQPDACLRAIEVTRASFGCMAITAFLAMLDRPDLAHRDLSRFRKVYSGGAPVAPATVERWEAATGAYIHNIYGLTETTSPSHATPLGRRAPADPEFGTLAVGVPVPSTDVRVLDPETLEEAPVGAEGEIVIKGPQVVPGYWNRPEATAAAFVDGYFRTGDVGKVDDRGYFYVVDRLKDMINAAGYKVWPREVEDFLYQHPAVREAAVVGAPDPYRGETVKAYISLKAGARVEPEEIIAFCRERMAAYKYPRLVEILDELPKTPTGKFLRRELRADGRA
jgi:long-chain acyl-CoA synthetase